MSQDTFTPHKSGPVPTDVVLHQVSRLLELTYEGEGSFKVPFELLRVYSPSAEVRGHGIGQEVLQTGKAEVGIVDLELVGNYALKPTFTDGHDSGLFAWPYLHDLATRQAQYEADYVAKLQAAGVERDAPMAPAKAGGSCAS